MCKFHLKITSVNDQACEQLMMKVKRLQIRQDIVIEEKRETNIKSVGMNIFL